MVLFVANFDKETDADDLRTLFSNYGTVIDVKIFRDRHTDESLGYGFVEIPNERDAEQAISDLNGSWWNGRKLKVNERIPRSSR
jgi:RNA recognition motif-containing protein